MPTVRERNERMSRILTELKAEVRWFDDLESDAATLRDSDCGCVATLPTVLVQLLDRLNDHDVGAVLSSIADIASAEAGKAFAIGKKVGREAAIHQFHEFIGVNRLCDTISRLFEDND